MEGIGGLAETVIGRVAYFGSDAKGCEDRIPEVNAAFAKYR
jgi:hypothetical protein